MNRGLDYAPEYYEFIPDALLLLSFAREDLKVSLEDINIKTRIDIYDLDQLFEFEIYPWNIPMESFIKLIECLGIDLSTIIYGIEILEVVRSEDMSHYQKELKNKEKFLLELKTLQSA